MFLHNLKKGRRNVQKVVFYWTFCSIFVNISKRGSIFHYFGQYKARKGPWGRGAGLENASRFISTSGGQTGRIKLVKGQIESNLRKRERIFCSSLPFESLILYWRSNGIIDNHETINLIAKARGSESISIVFSVAINSMFVSYLRSINSFNLFRLSEPHIK